MMIELIGVSKERDRARFESWLSAPHVSRWWGDPGYVVAQFDATPDDNHAIIARDGTPVGYIRWETVDTEVLRNVGLQEIPEGSIDVDLFIGESKQIGLGIGSHALEQLFDRLQAATSAPLAGLCSSVENTRAHAAFRKAGCSRLTTYADPVFGPCHVFVRWFRR